MAHVSQAMGREPACLLTLPRELRDEIYNPLLDPGRDISINLFGYDDAVRAYLALSATCRQTRAEAADVFFKNNFVWSIDCAPHYPYEHHVDRMKNIELVLDSGFGLGTSKIRIVVKGERISVDWRQQIWMMSATGGELRIPKLRQTSAAAQFWERIYWQRCTEAIREFHRLVVRNGGMNVHALSVLEKALHECWDLEIQSAVVKI